MREAQQKSKFGNVIEITKQDWVAQVNKAGEDVWVIVHVYSDAFVHLLIFMNILFVWSSLLAHKFCTAFSIPLCKMINQHLQQLAMKFPQTKFIKSLAQLCIPNYPEKNLPTVFVYREGDLKTQFIGRAQFGTNSISLPGTNNYARYDAPLIPLQSNCSKSIAIDVVELEWKLSKTGAFTTTLEEAPRPEVRDVMSSSVRDATNDANSDDEDDW